jgi:alkylated DNA repair dioxygenase AlkB
MKTLEVQNGSLIFEESFLNPQEAHLLFKHFEATLPFHQGTISLFGKTHTIPRLEAFFASENKTYSYSGKTLQTHPFTPELLTLKSKIEVLSQEKFNCVLVNLYRNGQDSNGWHADNEPELGINPVIASLSLGATRRFDLRHNLSNKKISIDLTNGSLLLMKGEMQHFWKHQIAKSKKVDAARVNLTFRWVA